MTKHANNLDQFAAAVIREGRQVSVALRRRSPAILEHLPPSGRLAVETYIATAEAVLAGGAAQPRRNLLSASASAGAPCREGRQALAVDQVAFLRRMEEAVGASEVILGRRHPVAVPLMKFWRAVCLGDVGVETFLKRRGLAPARSRTGPLVEAFTQAAERVADAIGASRNPWA